MPGLATLRGDLPVSCELLGATRSNVGRMVAAGVKVSLGAFALGVAYDGPRDATSTAGDLPKA